MNKRIALITISGHIGERGQHHIVMTPTHNQKPKYVYVCMCAYIWLATARLYISPDEECHQLLPQWNKLVARANIVFWYIYIYNVYIYIYIYIYKNYLSHLDDRSHWWWRQLNNLNSFRISHWLIIYYVMHLIYFSIYIYSHLLFTDLFILLQVNSYQQVTSVVPHLALVTVLCLKWFRTFIHSYSVVYILLYNNID